MSISDPLEAFLVDLGGSRRWAVQATRAAAERTGRIGTAAEGAQTRGEAMATAAGALTIGSVRQTITSGRPLATRERKFVVNHWPEFRDVVLDVVGNDDGLASLLRRALLRRFRQRTSADRPLLERIDAFELRTGDYLGAVPLRNWKMPRAFGADLSKWPPGVWDRRLQAAGLLPSWDYAVLARAEAFAEWLKAQPSLQAAQAQLQQDPVSAARLLVPTRKSAMNNRFWIEGWENVVGAWLEAAARVPHEAFVVDTAVLDSELGDPLSSAGHQNRWTSLAGKFPEAFDALRIRLSRSDIEFFFRAAVGREAQERGKYWLRFLPSVRKTTAWLCSPDRDAAQTQLLRTPNPAHSVALQRAGALAGDTSVFVLSFKDIVAVEFSRTGYATHLYSNEGYDELLKRLPRRGAVAADFRHKRLAITTLSHHAGWQFRFDRELSTHGVFPSSLRAPP
jgi:hypothetical protein